LGVLALAEFCSNHTDNCERLARLESGIEGVRREVATTSVQQSTQREEILTRLDRFEDNILKANRLRDEAVSKAYEASQQALVRMNTKLLGGVVGGGGILAVVFELVRRGVTQ
jgi:hypothetical protein